MPTVAAEFASAAINRSAGVALAWRRRSAIDSGNMRPLFHGRTTIISRKPPSLL